MRLHGSPLLGALVVPLLLPGCLQGRGPAGEAGNQAAADPTSAAGQLAAGKAYLAAGEPNDAFIVFTRAAKLDPSSYEGQLGLAQASAKLGATRDGLTAAEAAAKLKPKESAPLLAAGQVSLAARRLDEAERYFREALALDPKLAEAYRDLGEVKLVQGSLGESVAALERARDLAPQQDEMHGKLAAVYAAQAERLEQAGSPAAARRLYQSAIAGYREAVKLDPRNPVYPRSLAWLLITQDQDPEEARTLAKKADDLERGDGDALAAGAVALLRQGNADDALNELRDALTHIETNGDLWIYFAEASAYRGRPGDYENAVRALQTVQQLQLPHRRVTQQQIELLIERIKMGVEQDRARLRGS